MIIQQELKWHSVSSGLQEFGPRSKCVRNLHLNLQLRIWVPWHYFTLGLWFRYLETNRPINERKGLRGTIFHIKLLIFFKFYKTMKFWKHIKIMDIKHHCYWFLLSFMSLSFLKTFFFYSNSIFGIFSHNNVVGFKI